VLAIIPCLGLIAIIPGIIAIVLGVVGLSQASRNRSANGLSIAGLIIAIIACLISISQIFIAGAIIRKSEVGGLPNVLKEVKQEIRKNLNNENFSIRIEKEGKRIMIDENSVEINRNNSERQRRLEELEGVYTQNDSLQTK
jgi:hypothetical protein